MMENKRWKQASILFLIVILVSVIAGCGRLKQGRIEKKEDTIRKQKVTLIAKSTESAFWKSVFAGAGAASTEYNMELKCEGPENEEDYVTQNRMIEEAVAEGTDVIIFSAIDYEENAEAVDQAAKKGVKIVVIDSDVKSKEVGCRIGTDNYEAGCLAGKAALETTEEQINIGIVNFDVTTENGQSREKGFRDTVGKDSRTVIVDTINVNSTIDSAKQEAKKLLAEFPQINVLVTFNEWTSLGVGYAVKELGLADSVRVVAFDSNVVSVDMLETGEVDALIVQNPYAMGYLGVENAYHLLGGHEVEKEEINTSTHLVTKENMYSEESQRMLFSFDEIR